MGEGLVGRVYCLAFLLSTSIRAQTSLATESISYTEAYSLDDVGSNKDIATSTDKPLKNTTPRIYIENINNPLSNTTIADSLIIKESRKRGSEQNSPFSTSQNVQANDSTQFPSIEALQNILKNSSSELNLSKSENRNGYPDTGRDDFNPENSPSEAYAQIKHESNLLAQAEAEAEALAQIMNVKPHYNPADSALEENSKALEQILGESKILHKPSYSETDFLPSTFDKENYNEGYSKTQTHSARRGPDSNTALHYTIQSSPQGPVDVPVPPLKERDYFYNIPQILIEPNGNIAPVENSNNLLHLRPVSPQGQVQTLEGSYNEVRPINGLEHNFLATQMKSASPGYKYYDPPIYGSYISNPQITGGEYTGYNPSHNSHQIEGFSRINNAKHNIYNQELDESLPLVISKNHPQLEGSHYILPQNQVDGIILQAINSGNIPNTQYSTYQEAVDLSPSLTGNFAHNSGQTSSRVSAGTIGHNLPYNTVYSPEPHPSPVFKESLPYYSSVIPQDNLILLNNVPGAENLIRCTKKGQFHNLFTPSQQCLVCACVEDSGYLYPVCASCNGCPSVTQPTPEAELPASPCDPLPVGATFEHPLNPCRICMCYVIENDTTQIACQEDPQCVKATNPPLELMPHSYLPVQTPLCEKFPENVVFPHPSDQCQRCVCFKQQSTFSFHEQEQMQCMPVPDCGPTLPNFEPTGETVPSAPGPIATIPTISFTTPTAAPTVPANPPKSVKLPESILPSLFAPYFLPESKDPSHPVQKTAPTQYPHLTPTLEQGIAFPPSQTNPNLTKPQEPPPIELDQPIKIISIPPFGVVIPEILAGAPGPEPDSMSVPLKPGTTVHSPSTDVPDEPTSPHPLGPDHLQTGIVLFTRRPTASRPSTTTPLPWPPITPDGSSDPHRGPLLGPPPHESCRPYPSGVEFQHPWDDCQLCRCGEYHSQGHVSIEVNCYTKQSCCTELPESQLVPAQPEQIYVLDKLCELKTIDAEFADPSDACRTCSCRAFGHFVVPVCRAAAAPPALCASRPVAVLEIVYIEPRCRQQAPDELFAVGCSACACHSVYNYVFATCSPLSNCDANDANQQFFSNEKLLPSNELTASSGQVQSSVGQVAHHEARPNLSPDDIAAIAEYLSLHRLSEYIKPSSASQPSATTAAQIVEYPFQTQGYSRSKLNQKTLQSNNQLQTFAAPSYAGTPRRNTRYFSEGAASAPSTRHVSTARTSATSYSTKSPNFYPSTYSGKQAITYASTTSPEFGYLPYSYSKIPSSTKMYKSADEQEEDTTPSKALLRTASADQNSYPYAGEGSSLSAETRAGFDITPVPLTTTNMSSRDQWDTTTLVSAHRDSSTQSLSQQLMEAGGIISGRGRCQFAGDRYHEHCQACFCFAGDAELFSVCMGTSCNN